MITKLRAAAAEESGFTLVELLIVIAILGILAGVVVFSVAGITDNGQTAACKTEASVMATAQEAYFTTRTGTKGYAPDAAALKSAKLLGTAPTLVTTASSSPFSSYTVTWADAKCGTGNALP